MIQFIDGDSELRTFVLGILTSLGLNDRHNFLTKELDSWDTWAMEGVNRKGKIGAMCKTWLDKYVIYCFSCIFEDFRMGISELMFLLQHL